MRLLAILSFLFFVAVSIYADEINLTWEESTQRADGTPIEDHAGYRLYHSIDGIEQPRTDFPNGSTSYTIPEAAVGEHSFYMTSVERFNASTPEETLLEGAPSPTVSLTVLATPEAAKPPIVQVILVRCDALGNCENEVIE